MASQSWVGLYIRYPIVARAWPSARASKGILHTCGIITLNLFIIFWLSRNVLELCLVIMKPFLTNFEHVLEFERTRVNSGIQRISKFELK